ncbi:hypothetical protein FRB94_013358 [Tulasnella sp. JGI-2019a]|nr:hypothetical protein FRB94_013358 [Tulasnella sp. JGI-2019a]
MFSGSQTTPPTADAPMAETPQQQNNKGHSLLPYDESAEISPQRASGGHQGTQYQAPPQYGYRWTESVPFTQSTYSSLAGAMTERHVGPSEDSTASGRPGSNHPSNPNLPLAHVYTTSTMLRSTPNNRSAEYLLRQEATSSSALDPFSPGYSHTNDIHPQYVTPRPTLVTDISFHARQRAQTVRDHSAPTSIAPTHGFHRMHTATASNDSIYTYPPELSSSSLQRSHRAPPGAHGVNDVSTLPFSNYSSISGYDQSSKYPTGQVMSSSSTRQSASQTSLPSFPFGPLSQHPISGTSYTTRGSSVGINAARTLDAVDQRPRSSPPKLYANLQDHSSSTTGSRMSTEWIGYLQTTSAEQNRTFSNSIPSSYSTKHSTAPTPPFNVPLPDSFSSSVSLSDCETARPPTIRKRRQSPHGTANVIRAPRGRPITDSIGDRLTYPEHVHIVNIICPHPACWAPSIVEEPGSPPKQVYRCTYIEPTTGVACGSEFKRRGCIDRHSSSHSGRESKAVTSEYLAPGLARRLLWETVNLVETSNWSCLHPASSSPTAPHDAIAEQGDIAKLTVETEFNLTVLQEQAAAVRTQLINYGREERAGPPSIPSAAIAAVDLSHLQEFARLTLKRASTFERYYCAHRRCEADFTRVDALIRHERTCHKLRGKRDGVAPGRDDGSSAVSSFNQGWSAEFDDGAMSSSSF